MTLTFRLVLVLILLGGIAAGGYYGALFYAAQKVQDQVLSYLHGQNFEQFSYRRIAHGDSSLILYGVSFDAHDFYTVDRITVAYDPFDLLLENTLSSVALKRPAVTLEARDIEKIKPSTLSSFPVDTVLIEEGEINFLAGGFGDLILLYDADVQKQDDGLHLTARYKSGQPHIKLSGNFQGSVYFDKPSDISLTLDGVVIEGDNIQIKRSNGAVDLRLSPDNLLKSNVLMQLTAGSSTLFNFPWVNTNYSFEGNVYEHQLLISGKAADSKDTEFSYTYKTGSEASVNNGTVFSSSGKEFYRYLNRSSLYIIAPDDQPRLFDMGEVEMDFEFFPSQRTLIYYLPNKKGKAPLRREVIIPNQF